MRRNVISELRMALAVCCLMVVAEGSESSLQGCVESAPEAHWSWDEIEVSVRFSGVVEEIPAGSYQLMGGSLKKAVRDEQDAQVWRLHLLPAWSADTVVWIFPGQSCTTRTICDDLKRPLGNHLIIRLPSRPGPYRFVSPTCNLDGVED